MKKGFYLFASVFQLLVGMSGIIAFAVLMADGELSYKWIITFVLSVFFAIIGIKGLKDYKTIQ